MDKSEFIELAKKIHNDKYDYSKVEYVNNSTKVCIICREKDKLGNEHGEFWQTPNNHLAKHGCPKCNGKGFSKEYYIELAKIKHNGKYDYSKTNFNKITEKSTIICPIHGEFKQIFSNHLLGQGCSKCYGNERMTKEEFIKRAKKIHGDKYDYSKVEYAKNNKTKVCIICPIHGEFWQKPNSHLNGDDCPKCSKKHRYTTEEFIEEARKIHGDKYDYSKVEYINNHTKICIICPEHGEFWMKPNSHLSSKQGCPLCEFSYLEEKAFKSLSVEYEIVRQKRFEWLGRQSLDLYLPKYNIAIECQGIQHFKPIEFWGGEKKLEYIKKLDMKKNEKCLLNGIKIIYYTECNVNNNDYIGELFNNINKLKEYINETTNKETNSSS